MSQRQVIPRFKNGLPATRKSAKAAAQVHTADKAEEIARRIKDPEALRKALTLKLEGQRDFAAEYQIKFPVGAEKGNKRAAKNRSDTSVVSISGGADWCLAHGFLQRTVQRWLDLLTDDRFVDKENGIVKRCWQLAELWQAANYSSDSVEWYTPKKYVEAAREVLGEIDLDPASSQFANATVRAAKFFTADDDGLKKPWCGRVFMNPPYGKTEDNKSLAASFCNKAISEYEAGNVTDCIVLVNSLHSQAWQAPLYKHVICFVDHRIQFVSDDGEENKNPTFQNIFIYLGDDKQRFAEVFSRIGYVMTELGSE